MVTNQRGIALATSMVFLVVLSIIGINAMRTATLEQSMSSNMQDMNHAFQMAETTVARLTTNPAVLDTRSTKSDEDDQPGPVVFDYTSIFANALDSHDLLDAFSFYRGEGIPKGESMAEINSLGTTALHVFHVESTGKYNRSVSTHAQGITIIGPKTN